VADLATEALARVVASVEGATATLVPVGTSVAGSLVVLSILMLGAAIMGGHSSFMPLVVRMCGASAGTLWTIATWPVIVRDTFTGCQRIIGMLTGGSGILGLYTMAATIAGRIMAQGGAIDGWHPFNSLAQAVVCGVAAALVLLGLAVDGALVLLAQVEMLVAAAVAPLLLCGLAFGLSSQIGWGAVFGLVRDAVRVIATAFAVTVMAEACEAVVVVPGTDQTLSFNQMAQLMTLAVGTAMVGFAAYRIAGRMVGSPGVLGLGSVARVGVVAGGAAGMAGGGAIAAGEAVAGAAGAKGGRGGAAAGVASGSGGFGRVGVASSGSPFGGAP